MNGVEPFADLTTTFERLAAGHPYARIDELCRGASRPPPATSPAKPEANLCPEPGHVPKPDCSLV
jgi:hypothetical protein